ncbi:NAD(P)H-binding protein [Streptomyces sp. NPDC050619]|uniref:NAD(P)H-binding protein n=1 Tax=Streptomyces sp. NPDC050619 TaxID=3157214 RepID=UPI0034433722
MILVTGATGNIGGALLRQLRVRGSGPVRGLTRDAGRASFPEGTEAFEGDLERPDILKSALEGVSSLFLLSSVGMMTDTLAMAREAGVEHVVLVSSITVRTHPHLNAARQGAALERSLQNSGMAWTILRPTQFASNTLGWAPSIREQGVVRAPYVDIGLPTIHPADIAAVACAALTEPGHRGQTYALTGPERVTVRRQVEAVAAALGREVSLVEISRPEAHRQMASFMGDEEADAVLDLIGGDVNDELLKVHDTVARVTGSPARSFERWARGNAAAFR